MTVKPLKAYEAHDGDEGWAIVFETNGAAARRVAANEMDCEFQDVEFCRRAPALDPAAPGPGPAVVMIAHGWRYECAECGCEIHSEMDEDAAEDETVRTVDGVVEHRSLVFCCAEHMESYLATQAASEALKAQLVRNLSAELRRALPGACVTGTYAYVSTNRLGTACSEAEIRFTFPGAAHGGGWFTRSVGASHSTEHEPDGRSLTVATGDLDAFYDAFRGGKGGEQRWEDDGGPCRE